MKAEVSSAFCFSLLLPRVSGECKHLCNNRLGLPLFTFSIAFFVCVSIIYTVTTVFKWLSNERSERKYIPPKTTQNFSIVTSLINLWFPSICQRCCGPATEYLRRYNECKRRMKLPCGSTRRWASLFRWNWMRIPLALSNPHLIAERLSARQLILRRISEIVCMYVCMYVSVILRNPIISRATRKRSITCASVTLRNVTAAPAIAESARRRSPPCTTIVLLVRDVGDAVRTQRSGCQPEYEPIRSACNRLAQLSTYTYLLERLYESGARRVRST